MRARLTGVLLALVALVLVVGVGLTFVDRSTPPRGAPETDDVRGDPSVMTEAATDELRRVLESDGWTCYPSLPEVTRCFEAQLVGAEGRAHAEVAVTLTGRGTVGRVSVYASGSLDQGRHRDLARSAARRVGDVLLGGQGDVLAERVGRSAPVQVAGQDVVAPSRDEGSTGVLVESPTFEPGPLPAPELPPAGRVVAAVEALGPVCSAPAPTVICSDLGTGPPRTLTVASTSGRTTTVVLSAVAGSPTQARTSVLEVVDATGIGGSAMGSWLREHLQRPLALGDVAGIHVSSRLVDDGGRTTIYLTFGRIYA